MIVNWQKALLPYNKEFLSNLRYENENCDARNPLVPHQDENERVLVKEKEQGRKVANETEIVIANGLVATIIEIVGISVELIETRNQADIVSEVEVGIVAEAEIEDDEMIVATKEFFHYMFFFLV